MSAEILRQAAALMRERAEAATAFMDAKTGAPLAWVNGLSGEVFDMGAAQVAQAADHGTARHIASWHPAVALAVADWLEADATVIERHDLDASVSKAFVVATTYLGRDA